MAKILLGPVVGRVTTTCAIILLEVDKDITLECQLSVLKENVVKKSTVKFPAKTAKVFQFEDLNEDTLYKITIPELKGDTILGSLKTFASDLREFRIAAVSCDREKNSTGDMWSGLYEEINNINLCLHLGDNVYLDEDVSTGLSQEDVLVDDYIFNSDKVDQNIPYVRARKLLRNKERSEWQQYAHGIKEIFKQKYRVIWSRKPKATILANTSNLMILDDHDIRDDYGDTNIDSRTEGKEFFISNIAMACYHEYQRQLWDPSVALANKNQNEGSIVGEALHNEFYFIEQGPLAIAMLDARSHKAIYKSKRDKDDDSYFGKQQFEAFKKAVNKAQEGGSRILLVNSSLPLFFMKSRLTRFVANKCCGCYTISDDFKGYINYNMVEPYDRPTQELVDLIDIINLWKCACDERSPSTALILSGDLHLGGFTDIYTDEKKELVCRQISSGAISLKNFNQAQYAITRAAMHFTDTYQNYSYNHYDWTKNCNYVVLDFVLKEDSLQYSATLKDTSGSTKHGSFTDQKNSKEAFWDSTFGRKDNTGGTCFCPCCNTCGIL